MELFEDIRTKMANANQGSGDEQLMRRCFEYFDLDKDNKLNRSEFGSMVDAMFTNAKGAAYQLDHDKIDEIYAIFAADEDNGIDVGGFRGMWTKWIKIVMHPTSALIVVDAQNDFISGSLALCNCEAGQNGEEIIPVINHLLDNVRFDVVVYSLDWHPENHISFVENVKNRKMHKMSKVTTEEARVFDTVVFEGAHGMKIEQKLWPKHCVQDTWGAQLHDDLKVVDGAIIVKKGDNPDIDSYSAFWDNNKLAETNLNEELRKRKVTDVFVCGLAYDICVAHTAIDAAEHGFRTAVIHDGCRGTSEKNTEDMQKIFLKANGVIVTSNDVADMVEGKDRRPELGYKLAVEIGKS